MAVLPLGELLTVFGRRACCTAIERPRRLQALLLMKVLLVKILVVLELVQLLDQIDLLLRHLPT